MYDGRVPKVAFGNGLNGQDYCRLGTDVPKRRTRHEWPSDIIWSEVSPGGTYLSNALPTFVHLPVLARPIKVCTFHPFHQAIAIFTSASGLMA
jgi:hypothetical protein